MNTPRMLGLVAENSPEFVARAFSCWAAGAGIVALRSADDSERARMAGASDIIVPQAGHGWVATRHEPRSDAEVAQILFTSGTEGEPKGVVLTHGNLADVVTRLNSVMQVTADIREYVGVPVYHSFGFGRCRAVSAAGGRSFIPPRGFNPVEINNMLEAGEINAISAVPSLWRVLLQTQALTARAAARVRWIEIGSQAMGAAEKQALRALFPEARIIQHYGLTEASRSTFLDLHGSSTAQLESVGCPSGEVELRIASDGRIMIKGPHVTTRMLISGNAVDPRDGEGWLTTNDRGELRHGYLHYIGRSDDMINCGGLKLAPDALEAKIRAELGSPGDFCVCRIANSVRGDGILVVATPQVQASDAELMTFAVAAAAAYGVNARDATHVFRLPELPRTATGKIKRDELSKRFDLELAAREAQKAPARPALQGKAELRTRLAAILGAPTVGDRDTFVNLGGDSLRYIQASVVVERKLGYLPEAWETLGFAELEALPRKVGGRSQIEASVVLRALAISSVVLNHTGVLEGHLAIDGAAFLLLIPAGYSFARFQLQRVIGSGRARQALSGLPRIVVPTVLILFLQQLRHAEFHASPLLLYNNFIKPPDVFSYWFIEVFVQIHLLLALALSSRQVRSALRDHAYPISVVAVVSSALGSVLLERLWNTDHLGNLLPQHALWYFLLGWCVLFGRKTWQRWLNTALIVGLALVLLPGSSRSVWIMAGGLFLNWAPPLQLPGLVARSISTLASASLYVYITHFLILEPFANVFPSTGFIGQFLAAMLVGVTFWFVFERIWLGMRRLLTRKALEPELEAIP
jgi:acyl-CoA synthetase (AMP-forming)/AMP-acid ligase II